MTNPLTPALSLPTRQSGVPVSPETELYRRRIQKLPRKTRQVFLLSRLDQMPYTDIAQLMETDVESVERCMVRLLDQCADESADAEAARLQARRWYVHLQSPLATASQRIEFRHWVDADSRHLIAFQDTERLWCKLQAPATALGANGWHRRKRRGYIAWMVLTAFLCSLLVTAEAFT
ncbi:sigma factor-like helix-turn-helix DNA-binding protein [Pseudomonas sp. NPDC090203]|uniref:sigma factor-like helix-turn-helix DNA-binding protein n=1 Tax=Pseudomonas sp. NPDC090203 TaxID=3364477 RepID=UPI0037F4A6EC